MKKPLIGIVGRPMLNDENTTLIGVLESYRKAIIKSGGIPFLILPNQDLIYKEAIPKDTIDLTNEEKNELIEELNLCDGILMPGGDKMFEYDRFICDYALKKDIPLLGICMGMQVLARVCSGSEDNINILINSSINHRQVGKDYVHDIIIKKGSRLDSIFSKRTMKVNSRHVMQIPLNDNYEVMAYSEDGVIEAIDIPSKFAFAVQWHPESMIDYDQDAIKIFDYFIEKINLQTK